MSPASTESATARPDLAIICGYGSLPVEIARGAIASGRRPLLIGIEGEAEEGIAAFRHEVLAWGQIGKLFRLLKECGIEEVVFAGGIRRRPELLKLKLDLGALLTLPQALGFMLGGDNTVLTGAIKLFESRGIAVVGAHQIAPGLRAGKGRLAGPQTSEKDLACVKLAIAACKALGSFDIGQAAATRRW